MAVDEWSTLESEFHLMGQGGSFSDGSSRGGDSRGARSAVLERS